MYSIMSSANSDSFTSSFPICIPFISFFPVRCDSMARVDWSWVFSFSSFSRAAAVRNFPCPGQLGSDNTTAGQALVNWFPLRAGLVKKDRVFWCISKWLPFPSLCRKSKGIFLKYFNIYHGNLVKLLEVNLTVLWGSPVTGSPWGFQLSELSAVCQVQSFLPEHCFLQHKSSTPGSSHFLYSPVSPILWAADCPVSSPFLWTQEKLLMFQPVQLFTYCLDGLAVSKLLICRTRNQKSPEHLF